MDNVHRRGRLSLPPDDGMGPDIRAALENPRNAVRVSCENSFDASSALLTCSVALASMDAGEIPQVRTAARQLLGAVDQYFAGQGCVFKTLLPQPARTSADRDTYGIEALTQEVMTLVRTTPTETLDRYPYVVNFISSTITGMRDAKQKGVPLGNVLVRVTSGSSGHPDFGRASRLHQDVIEVVAVEMDDANRIQTGEKIISKLRELSKIRIPGIPDPFTVRLNGVSLQDLTRARDSRDFTTKALQYLTAIPKGNHFWQRVVQGVFFMAPKESAPYDLEVRYENQTFVRNVVDFRFDLLNALLRPIFKGQSVDRRFDRVFADMVTTLDPVGLVSFFQTFINTIQFYPSGMAQEAEHTFGRTVTLACGGKVTSSQRDNFRFLQAAVPQIEASLQARFPQNQKMIAFTASLVKVLRETDFDQTITQKIVGFIGPRVAQVMDSGWSGEEVPEQLESMLINPKFERGLRHFEFRPESFPQHYGVTGVMFDTEPDANGLYRFFITTADPNMTIYGKLNEAGEIVDIPLKDTDEHKSYLQWLNVVVGYSFKEARSYESQQAQLQEKEAASQEKTVRLSPKAADEALRSYLLEQ